MFVEFYFLIIIFCISIKDRSRAELFVSDFILTHLVGKDINEIWHIKNPMGLLTKVLEENGRQAPESRFEFKFLY